jgi:hypothetical protein
LLYSLPSRKRSFHLAPQAKPKTRLAPVETPRATAKAKYLQIANLSQFQHYKDRNPPWIKLHAYWLEHYEFQQLPDAAKYQFFMLMLLASRMENKIPNDPSWIATKIGASEPVDLAALLRIGVLEPLTPGQPRNRQKVVDKGQLPLPDASNMLAERYQDASTEQSRAETEGETEAHTETDTAAASALLAAGEVGGGASAPAGGSVCSKFSYSEVLRYVVYMAKQPGQNVHNPGGLARRMQEKGYADGEIEKFLRPPPAPSKRKFLDQPCTKCFGARKEVVQGKGARDCEHCVDEQGRRTGKEPAPPGCEPSN